jgi:predicted nuclease with TOPRIM domain
MAGKILLGILLALSLLLSSCYPELSVQQYDKLREDLAEMDIQRQELEAELETIKEENEEKDAEMRAYVGFLEKLVSTQSSERILTGEFDVDSLVDAKDTLTDAAESLGDNEITYYLGLMNRENGSQTVAAYYKVVEYCLKKMKQNLQ